MFAPEGFIPFSRIAEDTFVKNKEISERLQGMLASDFKATDENAEEQFLRFRASRAREYSFLEVAERALFDVTKGIPKYVFHPDKAPLSFDLPILMNLHDYKSEFRLVEHYLDEYGFSGPDKSSYFDFGLDWPYFEKEINKYVEKFEDPWSSTFLENPHTSMNLLYNRSSFLIDLDEARLVALNSPRSLDMKHLGYPFQLNAIEPFEGFSICVKEQDYNQETLQSLYEIEVVKIVMSACWGDKLMEELSTKFDFAVSFPVAKDVDSNVVRQNIALEGRCVKILNDYLDNTEFSGTLTDLRNLLPEELGARQFRRVIDRVRENHPHISKPGRRGKS